MKQMFIGGRWMPARDGRSLPVVDPSNGQAFDEIARGTAHEVDLAVAAARASLTGPWGRLNATERGRILVKIGQAVLDHAPELAALEARDTGKPMTTARNKIHGETIPFLAGHQVSLLREPLGVTAHIIPWNYPAQMLGRTVAPALAMGNGVVLKPAEDTSLSALRFAEIATAAGLPEGALNIVTGLGEEAGAALAAHPGIDFISFTGSNEVGTLVQQAAASRRRSCSRTWMPTGPCPSSCAPSCRTPGRPARPAAGCWRSAPSRTASSPAWPKPLPRCVWARPPWTWTAAR